MKKKVLFLTYDFPYPTNSGGKSRAFNLIKFGSSEDIEVILFSFVREEYSKEYNKELEKIGVKKIYTHLRNSKKSPQVVLKTFVGSSSVFKVLYFDKSVQKQLFEIIEKEEIKVIQFESFYTTFYITPEFKKRGASQIFGSENIEHILYYDYAKSKGSRVLKPLYNSQVERIQKEEEFAYKMSDAVLAVTDEEKDYIEKKTSADVFVVPNGVDTKYMAYKKKTTDVKKLLFVGNFSYFPNIDAMQLFVTEVLPKLPDVKLTVLGKYQEKLSFLSKNSNVKSIDYVEDIRDVYYDSDIFVFPVRLGGGTNFKILEAASCGVPIVAMPQRVKGLGFKNNTHYVAAETATEFVGQIAHLIEDKKLRETIAEKARTLIEKDFTWEAIGKRINTIWQKI